jgi:hypothetical protein
MAEWLRGQGYQSLFLDLDPEAGLIAGREWEEQLYARLRACRAVIVLCSPHSMTSDWCFAEITHARSLGKDVFPVKIAPCDVRPILTRLQFVDLTAPDPTAYARLKRGLGQVLGARDLVPWDGSRSPYPGLLAFQEADAPIFFGRDEEVRDGLAWLNRLNRFGGARLAMLLGVSGCGKSSLVRAGIIPLLRNDREQWLVVEPFRALQDPAGELAHALVGTFARYGVAHDANAIRTSIARAATDGDARALLDVLDALRGGVGQRNATILMVIDQFEELLAVDQHGRYAAFAALLTGALESAGTSLLVLGTLRSDLLGKFQVHALGQIPFAERAVAPMSLDGFAAVIEGPAIVAEVKLERGLVQEMVADTATEDALPLLAFTLRELWERFGGDGHLTLDEYRDKLGRLHGSLARAADTVMTGARLSAVEQDALRTAFLRMVRVNEEGQYVRQPATWAELPDKSWPTLQRFVDARLLVPREREGERTIEVAHEALFRAWDQLKTWLDQDLALLRTHSALRRAANDWGASAGDGHLLVHRGGRLEDAERLAASGRVALSSVERAYVDACIALRESEKAEREERQRKTELELYTSCILLAQQYIAARQYELAATTLMDCPDTLRNWEWGYLMGLAYLEEPATSLGPMAWGEEVVETGEPVMTFDAFAWQWRHDGRGFVADPVRVRTEWGVPSAFSRDGKWQVIVQKELGGPKHVVWVCDADSGETLTPLGRYEQQPRNASFSHDGARVVVIDGSTASIWNAQTGEVLATLRGHSMEIWGASFSSDGTRVVTASDDGTARVWDVSTGRQLVTLNERAVWRFSPVDRSEAMSVYAGFSGATWRIPEFSPDGRSIVVLASDQVMLWTTYPFKWEHLPGESGGWTENLDVWRRRRDRDRRETMESRLSWPGLSVVERPIIQIENVEQFVRAIGPHVILELSGSALIDLGQAPELASEHVSWHPAHEGRTMTIHDVTDLTIRAPWGTRAHIVTPHHYAFVLQFERCHRVELVDLVCGHAPEKGGCDRGVIGARDSSQILLAGCDLYGCGTEGLTLHNVSRCYIHDTTIRDCTYGILSADHCNTVCITNATFKDNVEFWGVKIERSRDFAFVGCALERNQANEPLFSVSRSHNVFVTDGTIAANRGKALVNDVTQVDFSPTTAFADNVFG